VEREADDVRHRDRLGGRTGGDHAGGGFVGPVAAIVIGAAVSVCCFFAVVRPEGEGRLRRRARRVRGPRRRRHPGRADDGLFASKAINARARTDSSTETPTVRGAAAAVGATVVYAFVATLIIYKLVDRFVGVRVTVKDEQLGLDLSQHREAAYTV